MQPLFNHVRKELNERLSSVWGNRLTRRLSTNSSDGIQYSATPFRLRDIPKTHPLAFGSVFTGMKTMTADIVVQKFIEGREELDLRRVAVFGSFGFAYLGAFQYGLYVKGFQRLFPGAADFAKKGVMARLKDTKGMLGLGGQLGLDQCVHIPLLFFPCYYTTKEAILGDAEARALSGQSIPEVALSKYKKNFVEDNLSSVAIWLPVNIVNFGFMPMQLRIPFMACISLGYCMFLSMKRGAPTAAGSKLYQELPDLDDATIEQTLQQVLSEYSSNNDHLLSRDDFGDVFARFGVTDKSVVDSLFQIGGHDAAASVPASDVAALLFTLSGTGDPDSRMVSMFSACDLAGDGKISNTELSSVMLSMIRVRERLYKTVTKEEAADFIALKTPKASPKDKVETAEETAERARGRLELLKNRSPVYAELDTVEAVLEKEAQLLVAKIFTEADIGDTESPSGIPSRDGYISKDEFSNWMARKSPTTQTFTGLFGLFK